MVFPRPDGSITYFIKFFNDSSLDNSITVAAQPYSEIPDESSWAGTKIEDPILEENAQAFLANGVTNYFFFKGNVLVQISAALPLDELVKLGKIIESRLPDQLAYSPITFPEQLDTETFSKYFNSISLAKRNDGSNELIPTTTFSKEDFNICLSQDFKGSYENFPNSASAIYDVKEKVYVLKTVSEFR